MPLTKTASISKSVRVGKFVGPGFLNVQTARGEVKMYHGDHIVEVDYTRPVRPGETTEQLVRAGGTVNHAQKMVTKTSLFVVPEDAARALGVFLKETVEEENERLAAEAAEREAIKAATPTK